MPITVQVVSDSEYQSAYSSESSCYQSAPAGSFSHYTAAYEQSKSALKEVSDTRSATEYDTPRVRIGAIHPLVPRRAAPAPPLAPVAFDVYESDVEDDSPDWEELEAQRDLCHGILRVMGGTDAEAHELLTLNRELIWNGNNMRGLHIHNTIIVGNGNEIFGNNNLLIGDNNVARGNNNRSRGACNKLFGRNCTNYDRSQFGIARGPFSSRAAFSLPTPRTVTTVHNWLALNCASSDSDDESNEQQLVARAPLVKSASCDSGVGRSAPRAEPAPALSQSDRLHKKRHRKRKKSKHRPRAQAME